MEGPTTVTAMPPDVFEKPHQSRDGEIVRITSGPFKGRVYRRERGQLVYVGRVKPQE